MLFTSWGSYHRIFRLLSLNTVLLGLFTLYTGLHQPTFPIV